MDVGEGSDGTGNIYIYHVVILFAHVSELVALARQNCLCDIIVIKLLLMATSVVYFPTQLSHFLDSISLK